MFNLNNATIPKLNYISLITVASNQSQRKKLLFVSTMYFRNKTKQNISKKQRKGKTDKLADFPLLMSPLTLPFSLVL